MYIWDVIKFLIYLPFCFKNFGASFEDEEEEVVQSSKTPVELLINGKSAKNKYDYIKKGTDGIYTTKDGYGFCLLKVPSACCKSDVVIWEAREVYEYADKVIVDPTTPKISFVKIFSVNGERRLLIRDVLDEWYEYDSHDKAPVIFNVNSLYDQHSDEQFAGDIRRYRAKEYCHFSEVVESRSNYLTVWKSKNEDDFAWKIVANGALDHYKTTKLSVFLETGEIIHYLKSRGNWEITTTQLILNLKTKKPTFEFSYSINGNTEIYTPRYDFVFIMVKNGNSKVWKSKNEKEFVKKAAIILNKDNTVPDTVVLFLVNGFIKHFTVMDTDWTEFEPSIVLNIDDKHSKNEYRYVRYNKAEHFIPVGGLLFRGVKTTRGLIHTSDVDIWFGKTKNEYVKNVMIIPSGKQRYLVLLLANNHYVIFFKSDRIKTWTECTDNHFVISELRLIGYDLTHLKPTPKDEIKDVSEISLPETVPDSMLRSRNLIDLDITKMYNFAGYTIAYKDNKVIFRARFHYLFKIVLRENEVLWQPSNQGEFPYKVVYKEIDDIPKIKVYFPDDKGIAPRHKPPLKFDPSDIQVQVVNYKTGDKKVEDELSHKPNTRFSWKVTQPVTHLNSEPP
ncbi:hypothetical protein MACJ_001578 [Theileria orientalis]|uniref:Uncharacterized protein n=1 Tax=Theileria orientalis TaxID=68886 RepID=A0A976M8S0_THEOR|nr:hypothetical protein MACJ_001578 [Theileria orientalis]